LRECYKEELHKLEDSDLASLGIHTCRECDEYVGDLEVESKAHITNSHDKKRQIIIMK